MIKLVINKVPSTSTSDPCYDLMNGYFKASEFSDDPLTKKAINDAIQVLNTLQKHLQENDLIE